MILLEEEKTGIKKAIEYFNNGRFASAILAARGLLKTDESLPNIALFLNAVYEQSLVVLQARECPYEILREAEFYCNRFFPIEGLNVVNISKLRELAVIVPRIKYLLEDRCLLDEYSAIETSKIVVESLPEDPAAWYSFAWILCRKNQYEPANEAIEEAWEWVEERSLLEARIYLCWAKILSGLNEKDEAILFCHDAKRAFGAFSPRKRVDVDIMELEELKTKLGI